MYCTLRLHVCIPVIAQRQFWLIVVEMMHAYTGNRLGMRRVLLRDHLIIFHGHCRIVQALKYAAHLCEDSNVIREILETLLTRVQRGQRLIESDVHSDQS